MWLGNAAIRPVPAFARLTSSVLMTVEESLGRDDDVDEAKLAALFTRFERDQPDLARYVGRRLGRSSDEVALALGYFLGLVMWLAFEQQHGDRLGTVGKLDVEGVAASFELDESLRDQDVNAVLDSDDVVALQQPEAVEFLQEHIDTALEVHAEDVNVNAVAVVYRLLLIQLLALSYAVAAPRGKDATLLS